jgi:two-component system sensor histidine kinase TctE
MSASIRVDLLKWLIAPLIVINLIGALLIYMLAWAPTQAALDQNLAEIAYDLRMRLRVEHSGITADLPDKAERILRERHGDTVYFTVRNAAMQTVAGYGDFPPLLLPPRDNDPFAYSGRIGNQPVRILVLKTSVGSELIWIGIAETLAGRREVQSTILLTLLALEAVLVIASVAIVWFAVTEGLFPLQEMRAELDSRSADDLSAVKEKGVPLELRPLIKAINGLLLRAQDDGKARQSFLANVAHQLRTPLAGFKAQVDVLQQKYAGEPEAAQSVSLMAQSTDRMIRQTNQLLALAKAEPSQFERKRLESVELDRLVQECMPHFVREADKKAIDLGFELELVRVMGDRFLLRDMLDNLIDNAIRYSPQGATVTVRCVREDGCARLVVEDNGPGVPVEDREKIFDRFHRLDVRIPGTGLGLAIVRDIAVTHDAGITVASGAGGKGTVFTVTFPSSE